jgi:hypothetical protein
MRTTEPYFSKTLFLTHQLYVYVSQDMYDCFHVFYISRTVIKLKLERNKNLFKIDTFLKCHNRNLAASAN